MELLKLLHCKNRCLSRFLSDSDNFLLDADKGDFSSLQHLQDSREAILKAISLYDRKISEIVNRLTSAEKTTDLIEKVKSLQHQQESTIQMILKTDQSIISRIEAEKTRLHKELIVTDKNSQIVQRFKSTWINEPGEKLDGKL